MWRTRSPTDLGELRSCRASVPPALAVAQGLTSPPMLRRQLASEALVPIARHHPPAWRWQVAGKRTHQRWRPVAVGTCIMPFSFRMACGGSGWGAIGVGRGGGGRHVDQETTRNGIRGVALRACTQCRSHTASGRPFPVGGRCVVTWPRHGRTSNQPGSPPRHTGVREAEHKRRGEGLAASWGGRANGLSRSSPPSAALSAPRATGPRI